MKTIDEYTIYCTEEQTKKAFELGADYIYSTAEQMIGWLEEQNILIKSTNIFMGDKDKYVCKLYELYDNGGKKEISIFIGSERKKVVLAAIDAALCIVEKQKQITL